MSLLEVPDIESGRNLRIEPGTDHAIGYGIRTHFAGGKLEDTSESDVRLSLKNYKAVCVNTQEVSDRCIDLVWLNSTLENLHE